MALASLSDFSCSEAFCCARNVLVCSSATWRWRSWSRTMFILSSVALACGVPMSTSSSSRLYLANLSCICSVAAFWMSLLSWMSSIRVLVWPMFLK